MERSIETGHGTIILRPAKAEDAPAYRELRLGALRIHPEAFAADYQTNLAKPMSYWIERMQVERADSTVLTYLAFHEDRLIGTSTVTHEKSPKTRHSGMVVGVYVRADWRGLHIADELIHACLDWARAEGVTVVKLGVATNNIPAIRCYARCGFTVYGVEPQTLYYNNAFIDELLMARMV